MITLATWWLVVYVYVNPADHMTAIMVPQSDEAMCIFNRNYVNQQSINSGNRVLPTDATCIKVMSSS
jgi:hypothetical protein